jgi:hypothetical protein
MNEIFHAFNREGFVVVYLHDVLVSCRDEEEHLLHLRGVFERLWGGGLFAKLAKCEFMNPPKLRYLGHIIGKHGPSPINPEEFSKLTAVAKAWRGLRGRIPFWSDRQVIPRLSFPVQLLGSAGGNSRHAGTGQWYGLYLIGALE